MRLATGLWRGSCSWVCDAKRCFGIAGLTSRRREPLLDFVDDQLTLSELDRKTADRADTPDGNDTRANRGGSA